MKLNWGFGIAAVYTLFVGSMIVFAIKASQQHYDLVSDNYYEDAVGYQQKIDAVKNASVSGLSIKYLSDNNAVEIISEGETKNVSGTLTFYKPDKAGDDFQLSFSTDDTGKQLLSLKKLAHGYWKMKATWNMNDKNCYTEQRIFIH
jgi:nitrogen fixation protein FixH